MSWAEALLGASLSHPASPPPHHLCSSSNSGSWEGRASLNHLCGGGGTDYRGSGQQEQGPWGGFRKCYLSYLLLLPKISVLLNAYIGGQKKGVGGRRGGGRGDVSFSSSELEV